MHSITFYPRASPTLEEVKGLVELLPGGFWHWGESLRRRGVVETEDAVVYIDYDDHYHEYFEKYLDEHEKRNLVDRLRISPRVALHLHASHRTPRSKELARTVCEMLA